MSRSRRARVRQARFAVLIVAALAGVAIAALVAIAFARTFTLHVAHHATVRSQSGSIVHENIAVSRSGAAVYTLSGDTVAHPKCTKANGCFGFWPPITVGSAAALSKAPGIRGRLGSVRRNGFRQVTLNGHPVYRFSFDHTRGTATGQGVASFRGVWHVVRAAGAASGGTSTQSTSTSTTTTSSSTPCLYPPC